MKKLILMLICFAIPYFLLAQKTTKQKEVGLVFSNLDNFGLTFKTGTEKAKWRFTALFLSGSSSDISYFNQNQTQKSAGFGLGFGREYYKPLTEKIVFKYGADVSFSYSKQKSTFDDQTIDNYERSSEQTTYTPGLNFVAGINYRFRDNIVFGAEILPGLSYSNGKSKEINSNYNNGEETIFDHSSFRYGFSNSGVTLSVSYRL